MPTEQEAIEKLIRDVDSADKIRTQVPRRILLLFAVVVFLAFGLLIFSLTFRRRDRPIPPGPRK
jgi:hypothetical protein